MTINKTSLPTIFLVTMALFVLVTMLFKPGELDITSPQHSDLYRYFLLSESRWLPQNWMAPRPLMLAYLKLGGIFHCPEFLYFFLAFPAIVFVTLLAHFTIHSGLSKGLVPIIALGTISFGSPFFYPLFQYDFGGMLAGVFAVATVNHGFKAIKGGDEGSKNWWALPLIFAMLSVESKPTYSLALLSLAMLAIFFIKGSRPKLLLTGAMAILIWVFIKDKLLGSPFIASQGSSSPYAIVIDPIRNIETLLFYIKNAFTIPLFLATLIASFAMIAYKQTKLLIIFLAIAISSSIPMALLANRQWAIYSWYSTAIVSLIVTVSVSNLLSTIRTEINLKNKILALITFQIISILIVFHAIHHHPVTEWTLNQQQYNRNILSSLGSINESSDKKILFAGTQGPYHPLKNTAFVKRIFPKLEKFDVLLKKNERAWNEMSNEQTNGLYLENIHWDDYSVIYVFDEKGRMQTRRSAAEVARMPRHEKDLALYCSQINVGNLTNPQAVAMAIECLNNNEEFEDSIALGLISVDLGLKQPWIYFHLAKSYKANGDPDMALSLLQKAVKLDPNNSLFLSTLSESQSGTK